MSRTASYSVHKRNCLRSLITDRVRGATASDSQRSQKSMALHKTGHDVNMLQATIVVAVADKPRSTGYRCPVPPTDAPSAVKAVDEAALNEFWHGHRS